MLYNTSNAQGTAEIAAELAYGINKGVVIALYGDMGSGKTVFAKGFIKAMGAENEVTSPTFTLMNEYIGKLKIYHFDLYRLEQEQAQELGFEEYLYEQGAISIIEWPDRIKLPDDRIDVYMTVVDDEHRKIEILPRGTYAAEDSI